MEQIIVVAEGVGVMNLFNPDVLGVLFLMLFFGFIGGGIILAETQREFHPFAVIWAILWVLPPLAYIWFAGMYIILTTIFA